MSSIETFRRFTCARLLWIGLFLFSGTVFGDYVSADLSRAELNDDQIEVLDLIESGPKTQGQFNARGKLSNRWLQHTERLSRRATPETLDLWATLASEPFAYLELRELAIEALGRTHSTRAVDKLEQFIQTHLDAESQPLHLTVDQVAVLALAAIDSIGQIHDPRACHVLQQVLDQEQNTVFVISSLRALKNQNCPRALRVIMNVYREDAPPQIRLAAAEALQNFTTTNLQARELLCARANTTEFIAELRAIADSLAQPCTALLGTEPQDVL